MPISVFNFMNMGDFINIFAVSNGETVFGADVHKQQLCRRGMRKCQLCDNFEIVSLSCEMKTKTDVTDEVLNEIMHSNTWRMSHLENVIDEQVRNTCNDFIDFIERKYVGSIIFITLVATKLDPSGHEKVYGEILVPKPMMDMRLRMTFDSITTDSLPVNRMSLVESMKSIFGSFEGTLINRLENLWDELETLYS